MCLEGIKEYVQFAGPSKSLLIMMFLSVHHVTSIDKMCSPPNAFDAILHAIILRNAYALLGDKQDLLVLLSIVVGIIK